MPDQLNRDTARMALGPERAIDKARIFEGNTQRPFGIQSVTQDLSTARADTNPLVFNFPFRSLYVQGATDSNVYVYFRPETQDSLQSAVKLQLKDVLKGSYPIAGGNFYWDAQAGKTVTLVFFTELDFSSGSQVQTTNGGVAITEGSAVASSKVTLVAATSAALLAQSFTRKVSNIYNATGGILYVGDSTSVAASNTYFPVPAGGYFVWKNSAALYGFSQLGGDVTILEET